MEGVGARVSRCVQARVSRCVQARVSRCVGAIRVSRRVGVVGRSEDQESRAGGVGQALEVVGLDAAQVRLGELLLGVLGLASSGLRFLPLGVAARWGGW